MSELTEKNVGGYQLVEIISETETALVFKGFQPSTNRYVAVKVLKTSVARDPISVQRFLQQGEIIAGMQYPNILSIYDTGQDEGVVYRVSSYVETGTLRTRLTEFYDPRQALGLIIGLAETLDYIHKQGYIHGNLKPTNIFLDEARRPLLTDFGMPQLPGASSSPYLAPEQVQGGMVDRRSDVYAMGVLLYEMLVGQAPPAGAVLSPRATRPELLEAVERVILKAMAQNPDIRFQSASEFRNALDAALRPVAVQPVVAPAQPTTKKSTNWVVIIFGVLFIIVVCAVGLWFGSQLLSEENPVSTEAPSEVTVVVPTKEERPTNEPLPTSPPSEPTQPPEQLPEEPEGPDEPSDGSKPALPCGSAGFLGGSILLGGVLVERQRRRSRYAR
ncbi:serine/threonine protein kinase [Chloroflexota bacterium]